jgi:TonB family protein
MRRFSMIALMLALATSLGHTQQVTPPTDMPVPVDQLAQKKINPPKPLNNVDARFSDEARRKKINGRCMISLTVDVNGMPQNIKVDRCTDPSFEASSLDAVEQYRFKPATTQEGKPVPVRVDVEINYRLYGGVFKHSKVGQTQISCTFKTPPGIKSSEPDADGVYPFTETVTSPTLTKFSDEGYGDEAFRIDGKGACDILLTISAKGIASDPQLIHCERHVIEKPAIQSLLNSKYKPGSMNGRAVPIRASIHLEYGGVSPKS